MDGEVADRQVGRESGIVCFFSQSQEYNNIILVCCLPHAGNVRHGGIGSSGTRTHAHWEDGLQCGNALTTGPSSDPEDIRI